MGQKIILLSVFLALCGGITAVGFHRAKEAKAMQVIPIIKPEVVRCAPLEVRPYSVTESFHGRIHAKTELSMAFQIQGRLAQIGENDEHILKENDMVEKGDVIAMLEPARFKAAVAQAMAQRNEASAEMQAADGAVTQAKAVMDDAKREYDRQVLLKSQNAGTALAMDRAETAFKIATAQHDVAKARYERAVATYDSANAMLTVANVNHDDAVLKAPIRGKIAALPLKVGSMIRPGDLVVRLVDMSKVKLIIGVVQSKRPQLSEGQSVSVEVLAINAAAQAAHGSETKTAPRVGVVTMVPPAANAVTGLFDVEIELENADGLLKPGMIAKATIALRDDAEVVAVPAEAVKRKGNKLTAFFVSEGLTVGLNLGAIGKTELTVPTMVVHEFTIEKAVLVEDRYLISGLPPGISHLVVEGQTRISDGKPVLVVNSGSTIPKSDFSTAEAD